MSTRRIVTGHDATGLAVFAVDEECSPVTLTVMDPFEFTKLWSGDLVPSFPNDGAQPGGREFFPPPGGIRFFKMIVPPSSGRQFTPEQRLASFTEAQALVPGLATHMERRNPGLHTSDSIDFGYVIDGEVWLELDGRAEKRLSAGDTFVQSATRHAWRNKTDKPCALLFVVVGVNRSPRGISLVNRSADQPTQQDAGAA